MSEGTKKKVIGKINELKSNIETFMSDVNIKELKTSINAMLKDAQVDFNKLVNKDLEKMKSKFQKEKEDLEAKAKTFLDHHKKELATLQTKIDKLMKKNAKAVDKKADIPNSSATTKKAIKKKVSGGKKVAGFKKSTTKKV